MPMTRLQEAHKLLTTVYHQLGIDSLSTFKLSPFDCGQTDRSKTLLPVNIRGEWRCIFVLVGSRRHTQTPTVSPSVTPVSTTQ